MNMRNVLTICCFPLPLKRSDNVVKPIQKSRETTMRPIALLTDFGTADHFVGSMKGTLVSLASLAPVIDICHEIAPGNIDSAAFMLRMSYDDFPANTIFVAVVDPGVGSSRNAIAVRCGSRCFIGPDNGVVTCAANHAGITEIRTITNPLFFREPVSTTFHGRDVFASAAARIASGLLFSEVGPVQQTCIQCGIAPAQCSPEAITGTVAHIDRFGNCITTIEASHIARFAGAAIAISVSAATEIPIMNCYADAGLHKPLAVIGSAGFLELCVNSGNAANVLNIKTGDIVTIAPA